MTDFVDMESLPVEMRSEILSHLDAEDLRRFRSVNKCWNELSSKHLTTCHPFIRLNFPDDERTCIQRFVTAMENHMQDFPFTRFRVDIGKEQKKRGHPLTSTLSQKFAPVSAVTLFAEKFGIHVKKYHLECDSSYAEPPTPTDAKLMEILLSSAPNLEKLTLWTRRFPGPGPRSVFAVNITTPLTKLKTLESVLTDGELGLSSVVAAAPNLNLVILSYHYSHDSAPLSSILSKLKTVEHVPNLHLVLSLPPSDDAMELVKGAVRLHLKVRKFNFQLCQGINSNFKLLLPLLESWISSLSPTLEELSIDTCVSGYCWISPTPFIIPLLTNLKKLSVRSKAANHMQIFTDFQSSYFPKLTALSLDLLLSGHFFPDDTRLTTVTDLTLRMPGFVRYHPIFPNIEALEVYRVSPEDLQLIFTQLTSLKHLSIGIRFKSIHEIWDVLSGGESYEVLLEFDWLTTPMEKVPLPPMDPLIPSIANMTKLISLTVEDVEASYFSRDLKDSGLMLLRIITYLSATKKLCPLQKLQLKSFEFSNSRMLKVLFTRLRECHRSIKNGSSKKDHFVNHLLNSAEIPMIQYANKQTQTD